MANGKNDGKKSAEDAEAAQKMELQNKFMAYQVAEQQIKQHQEQLMKFQSQLQEISSVLQALDDISKVKRGDDVLVPLAGGIFFRAKMEEGQKFLVNVGSNTVVEKSLEDTKAIIKNQLVEIEHYKQHVTENLTNLITEYQMLESELKDIIG
jgi:prefoldin alpha subunit